MCGLPVFFAFYPPEAPSEPNFLRLQTLFFLLSLFTGGIITIARVHPMHYPSQFQSLTSKGGKTMQTSNVETNIVVTGRHIEVTDAIRDFATKKIESIHIDYPKIVEARVVVDVQKDRQTAEIVLFCADHITIQASTTSADLYAAIDETVTKIMRRMRKHKTRLMKHFRPHRSQSIRTLEAKVYGEELLDDEVDVEAAEDPKPIRISREGYELKTMYKEDAIMELEISGKPFILYRNARRNVLQIVYRLLPGEYSIIELGNEIKA